MAHNTRIRSPGMWLLGTVVDPAEFEAIDAAQYLAIHEGGGTFALTDPLVLGGDGLEMAGPFTLAGTCVGTMEDGAVLTVAPGGSIVLDALGLAETSAQITVSDGALIYVDAGTITLDNAGILDVADGTIRVRTGQKIDIDSGGILDCNSGSKLQGTMTLDSAATISIPSGCSIAMTSGGGIVGGSGSSLSMLSGGAVTFASGSTCIFAGTNTISGATTQSGAVTRTAAMTCSGSSARTIRRHATLSDASATVDVSADIYQIPAVLSATRTFTLRSSTSPIPSAGEVIEMYRTAVTGPSGGLVIVQREDGTALFSTGTTHHTYLRFVFDGSVWQIVEWHQLPHASIGGTGLYGN